MHTLRSLQFFTLLYLAIQCAGEYTDQKNSTTIKKSEKMKFEKQLKTGINPSKSFMKGLDFHKYKYDGQYIEEITMDSILTEDFQIKFFDFLKNRDFDSGEYEQVFFIKLVLAKIEQVEDLDTYLLLNSIYQDKELSYFLEDYELAMFQLFLFKPEFFINGEYKYHIADINQYISKSLPPAFLLSPDFINQNLGTVESHDDAVLISEKVIEQWEIKSLIKNVKEYPQVDIYFSPSLYTQWQSEVLTCYNIITYLDDVLLKKLKEPQLILYKTKYRSLFNNYVVNATSQNYIVNDKDGFANIRSQSSTSSDIIKTVKNGEKLNVINITADWCKVRLSDGAVGFIHQSRVIKSRN